MWGQVNPNYIVRTLLTDVIKLILLELLRLLLKIGGLSTYAPKVVSSDYE